MAIVDSAGNVLTKAALQAKATTVTQPTVYAFTEDIYETFSYPGDKANETRTRKKFYTGQQVSATAIDALDPYSNVATVTSITPNAALPAAGGTTVTIVGTNLGGVTSVTFGGTAGTALKKVSKTKITVVTPAKTAGSQPVVVVDDGGNVTGNSVTYV